jgi:ribonuclease R
MLEGKINDKNINKYEKFVDDAALVSTERERAAENAEWDIDDYYKALYMQKHINEVYEGIISGMNNHGIFVELLNTVEGMIRAEDFPNEGGEYTYNAERFKVFNSEHCYRLGDKVKIKVTAVDDVMKKVRFVFDDTEYEQEDNSIVNKKTKADNGTENNSFDEEQGAV